MKIRLLGREEPPAADQTVGDAPATGIMPRLTSRQFLKTLAIVGAIGAVELAKAPERAEAAYTAGTQNDSIDHGLLIQGPLVLGSAFNALNAMAVSVSISGHDMAGIYNKPQLSYTGATTTAAGILTKPTYSIANSVAITGLYGMLVDTSGVSLGTGSTIANQYGIYVTAPTATATINYGLYVSAPTGGTANNYGLYVSGGATYLGGSVGIGASNPAYKLQIMDDNNTALAIYESGANGAIVRGWSSGGSNAAPTQTQAGNLLVSLRGGGYRSDGATYTPDSIAQINAFASEAFTQTSQGTYLAFHTTPNGSISAAERVRIDNAGNVGIGTTSPGYALEIVRNSAPQLALRGSWAGGAGYLRLQETGQPGFWETITRNATPGQIGSWDWLGNPDGGLSPSHYHQYMSFIANNNLDTTAGNVNFSGNMGIGTVLPQYPLEITTSQQSSWSAGAFS